MVVRGSTRGARDGTGRIWRRLRRPGGDAYSGGVPRGVLGPVACPEGALLGPLPGREAAARGTGRFRAWTDLRRQRFKAARSLVATAARQWWRHFRAAFPLVGFPYRFYPGLQPRDSPRSRAGM